MKGIQRTLAALLFGFITTYFIRYRQVMTAIVSTTIRLLFKLDCWTKDGYLSTEIVYFLSNCHRPFCHCCAHGEIYVKGNCRSVLGFYCHWNTGSLRLGHRNIWKCGYSYPRINILQLSHRSRVYVIMPLNNSCLSTKRHSCLLWSDHYPGHQLSCPISHTKPHWNLQAGINNIARTSQKPKHDHKSSLKLLQFKEILVQPVQVRTKSPLLCCAPR